jgi:hypothetical protein
MIIASLGVSIKEYVKDYLQLLAGLVFMCSVCSSPTHRHGWYNRLVKDDGVRIPILRVKCPLCKKTHAVLPEFLSPYKHYSQEVHQSVIEQVVEQTTSVERVEIRGKEASRVWPAIDTMRRWVRRYRRYWREFAGSVAAFLERCGCSVGVWENGFRMFGKLIALAEQVMGNIKGCSLFGKMNVLLAKGRPGLWI